MTGYALVGSATPGDVTRDGELFTTIGVDGVTLGERGRVSGVSRDAAALRLGARAAGRRPMLLVSDYNSRLGDFDEARAHRTLSSPGYRSAAVRALVRRATSFAGVQIDLESLRRRDTAGLVRFTRAVRHSLPRTKSALMEFMASGDARGYAARSYDLDMLERMLDVAVLMAYGYRWGGGNAELVVPQACRLAGLHARWSSAYGEWYADLGSGQTLWWDDARSFALRRDLARAQGLHGLAIWEIGSSGALDP